MSQPSEPIDAAARRGLVSVIYSSRARTEFDDAALQSLLIDSRARNERTGLSGLLLYRSGSFLQVLEGPWQAVWQRMSRIERDPRHGDVEVQSAELVDERQFGEWTMAYPQLAQAQLDRVPGYRDTFADLQDSDAPRHSQWALRELVRWFADSM